MQLFNRQRGFATAIKAITTWDIGSDIDYQGDLQAGTIRQQVMMFTADKKKLFHTFDRARKDPSAYVLTCTPKMESAARAITPSLLTFLRYMWPVEEDKPKLDKWFTPAAVARANRSYWDKEHQCVIIPTRHDTWTLSWHARWIKI